MLKQNSHVMSRRTEGQSRKMHECRKQERGPGWREKSVSLAYTYNSWRSWFGRSYLCVFVLFCFVLFMFTHKGMKVTGVTVIQLKMFWSKKD